MTRVTEREHLGADLLDDYSAGVLPLAEAETAEEHLLICGGCRERLRRADIFCAAARAALAKPPRRPARSGWWFCWAAVAVLAAGLGCLWTLRQPFDGGPPVAVWLQAQRGEQAAAPARRPLALALDTRGLSALSAGRLEIVDFSGALKLRTDIKAVRDTVSLRVPRGLPAGKYWVRLHGPAGLLREYGLTLR